MSITVNVRTTSNQQSSVDVESTISIKELKELISEKCGLGFCSALVFKGVPQRKDGATLAEINFSSGDTFVGVFRTAKPAAVPAEASAAPAAADVTATPAKPQQPTPVVSAPVKAAKPAETAPAPAAAPAPPLVEWVCSTCTYINIPARTICEMCETPDPTRQRGKATTNHQGVAAERRRVLDPQRIEARMKELNADQMDEDTRLALRTMVENDLIDEDEFLARQQATGGPGASMDDEDEGQVTMDLEELLVQVESNPEQKAALIQEFGLPSDASTEDLRQAIIQHASSQAHTQTDDSALQQQLSQLLADPAMAAQFQSIIAQQGDDPEALQMALMQLLAGGDFLLGDEDDEDIELDEEMGDL